MCTGFMFKGKDTICAYNLDISPKDFDYKLIKNKSYFGIAIKVGSISYFTHGVSKDSLFAVLPFMNDDAPFKNKSYLRIDLLVDRLLRNKITFNSVKAIEDTSNVKNGSLHALIASKKDGYIFEPGLGKKKIDRYQVVSNFPLLKEIKDENSFYGKDRYHFIDENLKKYQDLCVGDALYLLRCCAQEGEYSTKLSFVYSFNENKVYFCVNKDFNNILVHNFK